MPNPNAVLTINFNMKIDEPTDNQLIALAHEAHTSKAAVLRRLIRGTYAMSFDNVPTCADDTPCRCPHAHVVSPHLPTPPPPTARDATEKPRR